MNVKIYDPRLRDNQIQSNTDFSALNSQLNSQLTNTTPSNPVSTASPEASVQLIDNLTLEKQRKERNFNLNSNDQRIKEMSIKKYAETLSSLSQLKSSSDFSGLINNNSAYYKVADNQLGAALSSVLADGKVVYNGRAVNLDNVESLLKNDKDNSLNLLISKEAEKLLSSSQVQQKLIATEENYDTRPAQIGGGVVATGVLYKAGKMGASKLAKQGISSSARFYGSRAAGAGLKAMGTAVTNKVGGAALKVAGQKIVGEGLKKAIQTGFMKGALPLAGVALGLGPIGLGAGLVGFLAWQVGFMAADYLLEKTTGKDSTEYVREAFSPVTDWVGDRASEVGDVAGYHFSKLV